MPREVSPVRRQSRGQETVRYRVAFGSRGPRLRAPTEWVGLLKIERRSLRAPFDWNRGVARESFCGHLARLPTLDNGLNDIRRQEGETDQATHVPYGYALSRCDAGKRRRFPGADFSEPAMRSRDRCFLSVRNYGHLGTPGAACSSFDQVTLWGCSLIPITRS